MENLAALEHYAQLHCISNAAAARGLCFVASLEMAAQARRLGYENQAMLVRWRVSGELDFLEHWAVYLDEDKVFDLTAVQVDGDKKPLRKLLEYPPNFGRARFYPAEQILQITQINRQAAPARFSRRTLWRVQHCMFRHDFAMAVWALSPLGCLQSLGRLVSETLQLAMGYVLEVAIRRLSALLYRVQ